MSLRTVLPVLFLLGAACPVLAAQPPASSDACRDCHSTLAPPLDGLPSDAREDVHSRAGLSCADCHGGDPTKTEKEASKAPSTGYRGVPEPTEVPEFCGRCHGDPAYMRDFNPSLPTDQLEKYWTSHHGERLKKGVTTVATCVSCHGSHNILSADQPLSSVYPTQIPETCGTCHSDEKHMEGSGLPTDQLEKYRASVHGKALFERHDISGAPTCNDCHGNHGATPPGITAVGHVCGTCHIRNREVFAKSVHKEIFDALDMPECSTCHDHHLIQPASEEMLKASEGSVCMGCHEAGEQPMEIAETLRTMIENLERTQVEAAEALNRMEQKGMQVDEGRFLIEEARERLIDGRTLVHSFKIDEVGTATTKGTHAALEAQRIAKEAEEAFIFRRNGFAISTLIVTLVAVALYLKIREIESRQRANKKHVS